MKLNEEVGNYLLQEKDNRFNIHSLQMLFALKCVMCITAVFAISCVTTMTEENL